MGPKRRAWTVTLGPVPVSRPLCSCHGAVQGTSAGAGEISRLGPRSPLNHLESTRDAASGRPKTDRRRRPRGGEASTPECLRQRRGKPARDSATAEREAGGVLGSHKHRIWRVSERMNTGRR